MRLVADRLVVIGIIILIFCIQVILASTLVPHLPAETRPITTLKGDILDLISFWPRRLALDKDDERLDVHGTLRDRIELGAASARIITTLPRRINALKWGFRLRAADTFWLIQTLCLLCDDKYCSIIGFAQNFLAKCTSQLQLLNFLLVFFDGVTFWLIK